MADTIIPTGVKTISVLYFILSVLLFILGILFMALGIILLVAPQFMEDLQTLPFGDLTVGIISTAGIILMIAGIAIIILSILYFFMARGLRKSQNWARIIAIILSFIGIVTAIFQLINKSWISGSINLIFNAIIAFYLMLNKNVKDFFSRKEIPIIQEEHHQTPSSPPPMVYPDYSSQ